MSDNVMKQEFVKRFNNNLDDDALGVYYSMFGDSELNVEDNFKKEYVESTSDDINAYERYLDEQFEKLKKQLIVRYIDNFNDNRDE
ncbi:hypothetical protein N2E09_08060 [Leuconostoc citreum]